jgi:hypothetical protein
MDYQSIGQLADRFTEAEAIESAAKKLSLKFRYKIAIIIYNSTGLILDLTLY